MKAEAYIGRILHVEDVDWYYEVYDVIKAFKTLESDPEDWLRMRCFWGTKLKQFETLDEPISNVVENQDYKLLEGNKVTCLQQIELEAKMSKHLNE